MFQYQHAMYQRIRNIPKAYPYAIITLAAANMDYYTPQQAETKIQSTIAEGLKIAQTF